MMAETIVQKGRRLAAQIANARDAREAKAELGRLEGSVENARQEYESLLSAIASTAREYASAARTRGKTVADWRRISSALAKLRTEQAALQELVPNAEYQFGQAAGALHDARRRWENSPAEIARRRAESAAAEAVRTQREAQEAVKRAAREAVRQAKLAEVPDGTELTPERIAAIEAP